MILNGTGRHGETFEADVCVVGSGAAGLTLALDLADRGIRVLLVESGGMNFQWQSHRLLDVEVSGLATEHLLQNTRERYFGGTTNHWGGVCRTLDPFEFEEHPWIPGSGWPISRGDLDPYYAKAAKLLGLPEVDRDYDPAVLGVEGLPPLIRPSDQSIQQVIWRRAADERLRFGPARLEEVKSSKLLRCILNTTIAELHPSKSGEQVAWLEGRTFNKDVLKFKARFFVLCTGAIENARLLLASDTVVPGGLGNSHDCVGRYFMEHGGRVLGQLMTRPGSVPSQEEQLSDTELVGWSTTPTIRRELELQGFMAFFVRAVPAKAPYYDAVAHLLGDPYAAAPAQTSTRRKLILLNMEQAPNPKSRVMLSNNRDELGIRKPLLHLDITPQDISSVQKSGELLSIAIARSGLGRVHMQDLSDPSGNGGGHQMGTTRMSSDPSQGVTDADCRVHSLDNLYIGGSSLYPTGGWQHPTFTIVALALRLADHLAVRAG